MPPPSLTDTQLNDAIAAHRRGLAEVLNELPDYA